MHKRFKHLMPWTLTFSYSRALQQPALEHWKGEPENVETAQRELLKRAALNKTANYAAYSETMENHEWL
jgi:fructose-bisphosphate aldolase class I